MGESNTIFGGLVPVSRFNEFFKYPTVNALRMYQRDNVRNFNEKVIRKVGKRQYIDTEAFKLWIGEGV